jgi:hypothetical protein
MSRVGSMAVQLEPRTPRTVIFVPLLFCSLR